MSNGGGDPILSAFVDLDGRPFPNTAVAGAQAQLCLGEERERSQALLSPVRLRADEESVVDQ